MREWRADGRIRSAPRRMGGGLLTPSSDTSHAHLELRLDAARPRQSVLGGNIVLGRGMVGMVPPIALAYWRWTGAFLIAIGFAWPYLSRTGRVLLGRWRLMLRAVRHRHRDLQHDVLHRPYQHHGAQRPAAAIGWPADHHPLGLCAVRRSTSLWQAAGVVLSLIGVAMIAAHGSLEIIAASVPQPRRCMDPRGDGDLRHLRGDVPRAPRGAPA